MVSLNTWMTVVLNAVLAVSLDVMQTVIINTHLKVALNEKLVVG